MARTEIITPHLRIGQESESEFVPESVSGNVNDPLGYLYFGLFLAPLKVALQSSFQCMRTYL